MRSYGVPISKKERRGITRLFGKSHLLSWKLVRVQLRVQIDAQAVLSTF